jgi:diketogulonate reductase-like aldo/keto reductase
VALAWLLHQPHVTSVIIGAKKASQLQDNLQAIEVKLDAGELEQIDAASRLTPEYPGWMLSRQSSGRRPGEAPNWLQVGRPA